MKKHLKIGRCFLYCLTLIIYTQFNFLHSQGQNNYWYFGNNYGLNFPGSGAPVYISNGMVAVDEGSSVISDATGNLLFYTDGILVWDKNHTQMPNGFGLGAWYQTSSTQSAIIIQKPGSLNLYYIFCVDAGGQSNGLRYSIVDMTLNSGLGDIVTGFKNIPIHTPSTEKIAAVKHCNGVDVWIVTHDENSNQFRSVLLTSSGLNAPVISAAGTTYSVSTSMPFESGVGTMKISPDGKKLAICESFHPITLELFDFNNVTGQVSNPINLLNPTILGFHQTAQNYMPAQQSQHQGNQEKYINGICVTPRRQLFSLLLLKLVHTLMAQCINYNWVPIIKFMWLQQNMIIYL